MGSQNRLTTNRNFRAAAALQLAVLCFILLIISHINAGTNEPLQDKILVEFDPDQNLDKLEYLKTEDIRIEHSENRPGFVKISAGILERWPHLTITHPESKLPPLIKKRWDLSIYDEVSVEVHNLESTPLNVYLRIDSPFLTHLKIKPRKTSRVNIPPLETRTLSVKIAHSHNESPDLVGMNILPQSMDNTGIRSDRITALVVFTDRTTTRQSYEIGTITAKGRYIKKAWEDHTADEFFPFIDQFGQFKHDSWPGKTGSVDDLIQQREIESESLKNNARPKDWNQFGGWKDGPLHESTGHFYVKKVDGRWWLIDPEGKQFWSNGVDVVKADGNTIITDREHYFENLPKPDTPLAQYYSTVKKDDLRQYNFAAANLHRKYGKDWKSIYPEIVHKRLSRMGINTMGLWSDPEWTAMQRTPYVDWIYYNSPKIEATNAKGKKMVDMWHPEFKSNLEKSARKLEQLKDDPWLIGVFVDNELSWSDGIGFTERVLSSPESQPAKAKLLTFLREKYSHIDQLNKAWKTYYESWADLAESQEGVKYEKAYRSDGKDFLRLSADHYYKTVNDIIKAKAPDTLYLGSRLNGDFPIPSKSAAKYCDVVSYNLYRDNVDDFKIADGIDKPVIIGEFHFGSDDRGVFGKGLRPAINHDDRNHKYQDYINSALNNPNIVGAHWFQYLDQMATGRVLDGENYHIGLSSVTDNVYMNFQTSLY